MQNIDKVSVDLENKRVKQALIASEVSIISVEPLVISVGKDLAQYKRALDQKEQEKESLQNLLDIALTVEGVDKIGVKDLVAILASPVSFVASKQFKEVPVIAGLKISLEKIYTLVEKPHQIARLESLIEKSPYKENRTVALEKVFTVVKNKVELKKAYLEYLEDQYTRKHSEARAEDYIRLLLIEYDINEYLSFKKITAKTFMRSNLLRTKEEKVTLNKELLVQPNRLGITF